MNFKFLLVGFFATVFYGHSPAQTKIYLSTSWNPVELQSNAQSLKGKSTSSPTIGIDCDFYFAYSLALSTGLSYWEYGYDTKNILINNYKIYMQTKNGTGFNENISNKWDNSFLQIPFGIKLGPQAGKLDFTVGVNINYLLNSSLTNLKDSLNNYLVTDVTSAFSRVQTDLFIGFGFRAGKFRIGLKYIFALGNRYSTSANELTQANEKRTNAFYRSYYDFALRPSSGNATIGYTITQLSLSYRLF